MTQLPHQPDPGSAPHTGPADYLEGKTAADRFREAVGKLASLPKSAAPRPLPVPRKKPPKK